MSLSGGTGGPDGVVDASDPDQASEGAPRSASFLGGNFRPLPPDVHDRVFPIMSVVEIEPRPESPGTRSSASFHSGFSRQGSASGTPVGEEPFFNGAGRARSCSSRQESTLGAPSGPTCPPATPWSEPSNRDDASATGSREPFGFYTARHRHTVTEEGHMIISGVAGSENLQKCEDEPIRIPGAVQGFGCLVGFCNLEGETLDIRVVSENSKEIIGYSPSELFKRGDFMSILSDEQGSDLIDHLDFVRDNNLEMDGPEVFSFIVTGPDALQIRLWCAVHLPNDNPDLFVCEFELENDHLYPLNPVYNPPTEPEETLASNPTHEEMVESTMSTSRPLRISRSSRHRRGEAAAMEVSQSIREDGHVFLPPIYQY